MRPEEAKQFAALLRTDLPVLDLHGMYPSQALERLELFLYDAYRHKHDGIRIVFGVGTGALRNAVLEYVGRHPLVTAVAPEPASCAIVFT